VAAAEYEGLAPAGLSTVFQSFVTRVTDVNKPTVVSAPDLGIVALPADGSMLQGTIAATGKSSWHSFKVTSADAYALYATGGTLGEVTVDLRGPNSPGLLLGEEGLDEAWKATIVSRKLEAGTYYARVRAADGEGTGTYQISVKPAAPITLKEMSLMPGDLLEMPSGRLEAGKVATVRFFNDAFAAEVPAEAGENSVSVIVPPYVNPQSVESLSGKVTVQAWQAQAGGLMVSNPVEGFTIEGLPLSSLSPGSMYLAYLEGMKNTLLETQGDLAAISAVSDGKVALPSLQTDLAALLNQITNLKQAIEGLTKDPEAKIVMGVEPTTNTTITVTSQDLVLLDRMIAAKFAPMFEAAESGGGSAPGPSQGPTPTPKPPGSASLVKDTKSDEERRAKIERWNELSAQYRLAVEQNTMEAEKLGKLLYGGGTFGVGCAGLLGSALYITGFATAATFGLPVTIVAGGVMLFLASEKAATTATQIREIARDMPGSTLTDIEIQKKQADFQQQLSLDYLTKIVTDIAKDKVLPVDVTGVTEKGVDGFKLYVDIVDTATDIPEKKNDLIELYKQTVTETRNPIDKIEHKRAVFVTGVPSNPSEGQGYVVDVRVNPGEAGIHVTVTVHGTDGFSTSGSGTTDASGFARIMSVPGAKGGVVDTITAVARIAAGDRWWGAARRRWCSREAGEGKRNRVAV